MHQHAPSIEVYSTWRKILPIAVLLTAIGTGCGNPYPYGYQNSQDGGTTTLLTETTGGQGSGATITGRAPAKVPISGTGYDSVVSIKVTVGQTLKVAFIPGKQKSTASDGVFYPYSILGVYIGIGANIQPTEMLQNGYTGGSAAQSSPIDLSDSFTNTCNPSDKSCRQQVTLTISKAQSDDGCYSQPGLCIYGYTHVPSGHPWNGTLLIQTDDTGSL